MNFWSMDGLKKNSNYCMIWHWNELTKVGDNDSFLSYNTLPLSQQARKKLQGRAEKKNFSFLYNFFLLLLCFPPLFNQNDTMKRILKAQAKFSVEVGKHRKTLVGLPKNAQKLIKRWEFWMKTFIFWVLIGSPTFLVR